MTDKNKRILSKLYLTALTLSVIVASLATTVILVYQIHDGIVANKAEKCLNHLFDDEYFKKYGKKLTEDANGLPNIAYDKLVNIEDSAEYKLLEDGLCNVTRYGDNKFTSGWAGNFELYQKFFNESRLSLLVCLALLWAISALLIALRKWVAWLIA